MKRTHMIMLIVTGLLLLVAIGAGIATITSKTTPVSDQPDTFQTDKIYTKSQVLAHSTKDDCWTIIDGSVYDLTSYINRHPGGEEIMRACGGDATTLFDSRRTDSAEVVGSGTPHSENAREQLRALKIGIVRE